MRFHPSKDCSFYAENLNAWERQKECPPAWENHRNRPEIYWPTIDSRIPILPKEEAKPKKPKLPVLDARGCPIKPIITYPPILYVRKPIEEKCVRVIYYFRDIEGAKMKRIRDEDLYNCDFPKKIKTTCCLPPPREMSLSLRAYRAKLAAEKEAERQRRIAARLARKLANMPKC